MSESDAKSVCSFCGKDRDKVRLVLGGSDSRGWVSICHECVGMCADIFAEEPEVASEVRMLVEWRAFDLKGQDLEWSSFASVMQSEEGRTPIVLVVVRKLGNRTGPAKAYPVGTLPTEALACEVVELFADELMS